MIARTNRERKTRPKLLKLWWRRRESNPRQSLRFQGWRGVRECLENDKKTGADGTGENNTDKEGGRWIKKLNLTHHLNVLSI